MTTNTLRPVRRALISVSDKSGLVDFAKALQQWNVEIISTGGSAATLKDAGIAVVDVAEVTQFPEMMDGRVKTLHPKIHGGLLAVRDNPDHATAMESHGIAGIDLLVVNLYPFEETVERGADFDTTIENIDIGGPALIRAAAKNHDYVSVVVDKGDYELVLDALKQNDGSVDGDLRRRLAAQAYARTAAYDAEISKWFSEQIDDAYPIRKSFTGTLRQTLRYGENPHQSAAFYVSSEARVGIATAEQIQGKELSYNNLNDTDAAFELVSEFDPAQQAAVAIIKHANPCGVALDSSLLGAYNKALRCDPVSAFGGIIAVNQTLDGATAEEIAKLFAEVVIAPEADEEARKILASKKNLRVLLTGGLADAAAPGVTVRSVAGGLLVQSRDNGAVGKNPQDWKVVTKLAPTDEQIKDLSFAFTVAKHVKSNAIVYARDLATSGIGAGQMSRVDSTITAARKAAEAAREAKLPQSLAQDSVVASDAFFPFPDGVLTAAEAGAKAVVQPGGSIRDDEVIAAADEAGLAMVFTGMRHFRH